MTKLRNQNGECLNGYKISEKLQIFLILAEYAAEIYNIKLKNLERLIKKHRLYVERDLECKLWVSSKGLEELIKPNHSKVSWLSRKGEDR